MIINSTKDKVIVNRRRIIYNLFDKTIGLMFARKLRDKGLVFCFDKEKRYSLHMFFVFQKIDVLFLDKKKTVVDIKKNFRPFTFYSPKNKAKYIIELPYGSTAGVELGDVIRF